MQIKSKKKVEEFVAELILDTNYMIHLRRFISSYIPKTRNLSEFTDIKEDVLKKLEKLNIKNSIMLYEFMKIKCDDDLYEILKIRESELKEVRLLLELGQLRYVSPVFAKVLVACGYESIKDISEANATKLYDDIISTNKEKKIYKGNIGKNDAEFLIDDAKVFLKYSV